MTCDEPSAAYDCQVPESARLSGYRGGDRALQLVCITEIARARGHRSCSVRAGVVGACLGEPFVVGSAPPLPPALPGAPAQSPASTGADQPQRAAAPPDQAGSNPAEGPPKTLVEMADRASRDSNQQLKKAGQAIADSARATGKGIENAGSAVGTAAKKTWKCLSSLFSDC